MSSSISQYVTCVKEHEHGGEILSELIDENESEDKTRFFSPIMKGVDLGADDYSDLKQIRGSAEELCGQVEKNGENLSGHSDEDESSVEREFLWKLKTMCVSNYIFRKTSNTVVKDGQLCPATPFDDDVLVEEADPVMEGMDLVAVKHFDYSDLKQITDSFSESNLICNTIFGRLFRGTIDGQDVLVKTWDPQFCTYEFQAYNALRISDELVFLRKPSMTLHPNVVKLIGYSCDKKMAAIYEGVRPKRLLEDIIESDEFQLEDRLQVALDIARTLKAFHDEDILHRGLLAKCFLICEDSHVISYDFNMEYHKSSWRQFYVKHHLYSAAEIANYHLGLEAYKKEDVFGFGFLLMELVSKNKEGVSAYRQWEELIYNSRRPETPLIHESFGLKEEFVLRVEKLVISCLKLELYGPHPSINDVIVTLEELVSAQPAIKRQKVFLASV